MAGSDPNICLLIGHPRSGTTFLHRFMLENYRGLVGKKLEDMVFMSFHSRIQGPLKAVAGKLPLSLIYRPEIHRTGMQEWECDDIAFSIQCQAGYLFWLYRQCRSKQGFDASDFAAWLADRQQSVMACWDHLHLDQFSSGGEGIIFSKSFVMLFYIEEFLAKHPDGRVILMTRTPLEVVPSVASLLSSVHRRLLRLRRLRKVAIENILHSVSLFYRKMSSVLENPDIANRCLHLTYNDLSLQLPATCDRIANYLPSGEWNKLAVSTQAERQAQWISPHRYSADEFGLSPERIADEVPYAY